MNLAHGRSLRPRADGDGDSSGSSAPPDSIVIAHGICMALAFVVLFPLGASWMRFFNFKRLAWFHGGWQVLTYILVLAGMGIGIYLAVKVETVSDPAYSWHDSTYRRLVGRSKRSSNHRSCGRPSARRPSGSRSLTSPQVSQVRPPYRAGHLTSLVGPHHPHPRSHKWGPRFAAGSRRKHGYHSLLCSCWSVLRNLGCESSRQQQAYQ